MTIAKRPLYEIEEQLEALQESGEMAAQNEELLVQWLAEIAEATEIARDKRDAVAVAIQRSQDLYAALKDRRNQISSAMNQLEDKRDRLEEYVLAQVEQHGKRRKPDGPLRLEGNYYSLSTHKNPDAIEFVDAQRVPIEHQRALVKLSGSQWNAISTALEQSEDMKTRAELWLLFSQSTEWEPMKREILAELKAGREVPGTDLRIGGNRLDVSVRNE